MINSKIAHGFVPSDLLIQSAIKYALHDLRKNPYLLDYCFNWFANDCLTNTIYGDKEKETAKEWFLNHEIFVSMNYRADDAKFPLISIGLSSSIEDTSTLSDANSTTQENIVTKEVLVVNEYTIGPFNPDSYNSVTGNLSFPEDFNTDQVATGMTLYSYKSNTGIPILEVIDSKNVIIGTNINIDLSTVYIAPRDKITTVSLESCIFRESYAIRAMVQGDPLQLLYLHTILVFILMRYKEELFEKRGFDRSTISSGAILCDTSDPQYLYSRDVNINGYVRQYWPKAFSTQVQGFDTVGIKVIAGVETPENKLTEARNQGWWMDIDPI